VVKSKHVSGEFATTGVQATINHPHQIAVKLAGHGVDGDATVGCPKGLSDSAYSKTWHKAGTYRLKIQPAGATSCDVTAAISGSTIRVSILKRK
jgi:hypothetical protein